MDIGNALGKVLEFATSSAVDYIHGQQGDGAGIWDRQVLFLKDADPLGPNYFVLRDSTTGQGTANYWLWLNTKRDGPQPDVPANLETSRTLDRQALPPTLQIGNDVVHAIGEHDVDLDVWFAPPNPERLPKLEIKELTVATVKGLPNDSWTSWDGGKTTQLGLHLIQPRGEALVSLLYPRLRNEPAPQLTSLADGKVVKVVHALGTDYAFLALEPFEFADGPVQFNGTAGAI